MKSIVLLISVVLNNGATYTAPAVYFDTPAECSARMTSIMSHKYPFQVRAFCATAKPEVEEK